MSKKNKSGNNRAVFILLTLILILLAVLVVIMNGSSPISKEKEVSVNSVHYVENKENEPNITADSPIENQVRSKLSGQFIDRECADHVPYAVMYSNVSDAMPQANISQADVVFEALVEGKITRMCCLFEDKTALEKIGPVRSCRTYFLLFAKEFEAIYVHFGYSEFAEKYLQNNSFHALDGMSYCNFYRTNDRVAPHNAYTSWAGITDSVRAMHYPETYPESYIPPFTFNNEENAVTPRQGTACHRVDMNFPYNMPWFEYDSEKGCYLRYQFNGAQVDQQTGEQLAFDNILIKYVEPNYYENGTPNYKISGTGQGYFITNGYGQKVTWVKENELFGATKYYYEDGTEIVLNPGKTYIALVESTQGITVQ